MRHFGEHIKKGKLATMIECQQCKKAEDLVLAGRSIQNLRDFVRNRGVTLKRKSWIEYWNVMNPSVISSGHMGY